MARLIAYGRMLEKWRGAINLVSRASLGDLWRRHMLDSAQLSRYIHPIGPDPARAPVILDLGSGAGFPGLVLAILGGGEVHLVESNGRKCTFLRQVIRETAAPAVVHNVRIEDLPAMTPDVITSRALAEVANILELAENCLGADTEIWLLKGQHIEKELTRATISWNMQVEKHPSRSDPSGTVLCLKGIQRVEN